MVNLDDWIQKQWYRWSLWHFLLIPLSLLFWLLSAARRLLYRFNLMRGISLPVPVIVVGNISVGGTGKTPFVLWLVSFLQQQGWHPAIISRGYGGSATGALPVNAQSDPAMVGDESVLLARRSACPVWIGQDRVAVAQALLEAHPECDVLVSDDGLQHYRLKRDVEIALVDGSRQFGNAMLLPAGPLREGVGRLYTLDAVVVNRNGSETGTITDTGHEYRMQLLGRVFYSLQHPEQRIEVQALQGKRLHAIAGIGNPSRFFEHLRNMGLEIVAHAFPDHHAYTADELNFADADATLMTEKDAVKCTRLDVKNAWVLAVDAKVDAQLGEIILNKLRNSHGSKIT